MREIRTLRAKWRGLETGSRIILPGHEGGSPGYRQGRSYGPPRQSSTPPGAVETRWHFGLSTAHDAQRILRLPLTARSDGSAALIRAQEGVSTMRRLLSETKSYAAGLVSMGAILLLALSCASSRPQDTEEVVAYHACCDPIFEHLRIWQEKAEESGPSVDDKTRTRSISLLQELELGDQYAAQIAKKYTVEQSQRLEEIANKLTRFADRPILTYEVHLLDTAQINAFSIPGGKLYVTKGLLESMEPTNGELAFILSHEMAHAALRHLATMMERGFADFSSRVGICGAAKDGRISPSAVGATFQALDFSSHINSTQGEFQADQYGALYMVQAGYAFSDGPSALKKLIKLAGDVNQVGTTTDDLSGGSIWSLPTHPPTTERIDQLERFRNQLEQVASTAEDAIHMMEEGRYEEADERFRLILKVFPESRAMRLNLALASHLQFRESQDNVRMTRGTLSDPEKLEVQWVENLMRGSRGIAMPPDSMALKRALAGYEYTLSLDPNHFPARNDLGVAYLDCGEVDRAIPELQRTLSTDRTYAPAYRNLTIAYLAKLETVSIADPQAAKAKALTKEIQRSWHDYQDRSGGALVGDDEMIDARVSKLGN